MHPLRLLALIGIALPVFAATPLSLHRGSTREWVRRVGYSGDSVRYHLEFLDSTSRDSTSDSEGSYTPSDSIGQVVGTYRAADTTIDWRVRITRSDSPSVADTAILRVVRSRWFMFSDSFPPQEKRRIQGLAFWLRPSRHFPIDLQLHSNLEWSVPGMRINLTTGVWEAVLLIDPTATSANWSNSSNRFNRSGNQLCSNGLGSGSCYDAPMATSRDSLGIVAWRANGTFWELRGVDGTARPPSRSSLGHALRKGESWVYRDSSESDYLNFGVRSVSKSRAFVALELLSTPSDSAGWIRLSVRESVHPDSGTSSDTTYAILLDTLQTIARIGTLETTPENLSSGVPSWALGLMKHPQFPDSSKSSYRKSFSRFEGEAVVISSSSYSYLMSLDYEIGATSITSRSSSAGVGSLRGSGYSFWTLVTHSLDNKPLPTMVRLPAKARNLSWLRTRIAHDPSLEIIRIAPDGSSTRARGAEASKLLDARGVGIVRFRDGQHLVTLPNIRP